MNLFEFQDYRQALNEWVRHRKHWSKSISWMKIAAQVRIERTYLSKVIRQKAHLSSDQLFSICEALGIEPEQRSYLELLLEYERSNVKKRKEQFFEKIKELQKKNSMLENKVQAKVIRNQESPDLLFYYLDPNVQIIHQALQLKSLAQNLEQLKNALGISSDRFNEILEQLEKSKIISIDGDTVSVLESDLHLSRSSSWYTPHHALVRLKSLEKIQHLTREESHTFSATFTADETTNKEIQAEFGKFIQKCQKASQKSVGKNVYQLNLDLFPWIKI